MEVKCKNSCPICDAFEDVRKKENLTMLLKIKRKIGVELLALRSFGLKDYFFSYRKEQVFYWTLAFISIIATILNVFSNKICFFIWLVTNLLWMIVDYKKKIYPQAFLFFIYFILAILGIINWK